MKQANESDKPVKTAKTVDNQDYSDKAALRQLFISSALNMSWQLAIVVLVPIVGGYKLDQAVHTFPDFLIVGLIIAIGGTATVLHRQLKQFGPPPSKESKT